MSKMNTFGRAALCGIISTYNAKGEPEKVSSTHRPILMNVSLQTICQEKPLTCLLSAFVHAISCHKDSCCGIPKETNLCCLQKIAEMMILNSRFEDW